MPVLVSCDPFLAGSEIAAVAVADHPTRCDTVQYASSAADVIEPPFDSLPIR